MARASAQPEPASPAADQVSARTRPRCRPTAHCPRLALAASDDEIAQALGELIGLEAARRLAARGKPQPTERPGAATAKLNDRLNKLGVK
jgi:hypothetical protein